MICIRVGAPAETGWPISAVTSVRTTRREAVFVPVQTPSTSPIFLTSLSGLPITGSLVTPWPTGKPGLAPPSASRKPALAKMSRYDLEINAALNSSAARAMARGFPETVAYG